MNRFVMISLTSITLFPNSFSSVGASLVRASTFDGWPCSYNSCWVAKSPSLISQEGIFKAVCTDCLCSAHNWGSWKEMKHRELKKAHVNECQITRDSSHMDKQEWTCPHLITEGTSVRWVPAYKKTSTYKWIEELYIDKGIVLSHKSK